MAATRHFQLGAPRGFSITAQGTHVVFLRSDHGRDAVNSLWLFDVAANVERKLADPRELLADSNDIPDAERARRERMRETTSGITSYSLDDAGSHLAFALAGQLYAVTVQTGAVNQLAVPGPIIDPQVSPDGQFIAWSDGKDVFTADFDGSNARALTSETASNVAWGLADFIAAEEFGRMRGMWWSPQSDALLVERVDETNVETWWISDPANPHLPPREQRYPQCGTTNANVSLFLISLDGSSREISWDNNAYEYLVSVSWQEGRAPLVTVANRSQTEFIVNIIEDHALRTVHAISDPEFVEVISGQPKWVGNELLTVQDNRLTDTREIHIGERCISPIGLQVMSVIDATETHVDVIATTNAVDRAVMRIGHDGTVHSFTEHGLASATNEVQTSQGALRVVVQSKLLTHERSYALWRDGMPIHFFDSNAEKPSVEPTVINLKTGSHNVNTAVLFPSDHVMGSKRLPVLLRPYGGPHGAQVLNGATNYAEDQWFADQGFVVIIADGRGTPGRGPLWDHSIYKNFVEPVLDDQQEAIRDVAREFPDDVDASRVGITGWSFGGYLAALAVLKRPDIFHVAVAGAPVTDWKLYDTAYTERYLGHPDDNQDVYRSHSLLELSGELQRPLLLIHGLADDNVVAAHTLQLSSHLLAHKGTHSVLPLSGVTHMTPQEVVLENLALQTVGFFKQHLQ